MRIFRKYFLCSIQIKKLFMETNWKQVYSIKNMFIILTMLLKYTNSGIQFNNKTNHQKITYFHWEKRQICFFSFNIYSAYRWPLGSES